MPENGSDVLLGQAKSLSEGPMVWTALQIYPAASSPAVDAGNSSNTSRRLLGCERDNLRVVDEHVWMRIAGRPSCCAQATATLMCGDHRRAVRSPVCIV